MSIRSLAPQDRYAGGLIRPVVLMLTLQSLWPALAVAQIDTEAINDTAAGADSLPLPLGSAIVNRSMLSRFGDDVDFFSTQLNTGDVLLGMTTSWADLPSTFDAPDTVAGVFNGGTLLTYNDDDGADSLPFSAGYGSLFRYLSAGSGTYQIGITGTGDEEFDGDASGIGHSAQGPYAVTAGRVNPATLGGGFGDSDPLNDGIFPSVGRPGPFVPDMISLASVSAHVAVAELVASDVDFYAVELTAGDILSAMTAPLAGLINDFDSPDTVLGLFNSAGVRLFENDDAGNEAINESSLYPDLASDNPFEPTEIRGSALRALIPTTGTYYLGVTGYSDVDYVGSHGEQGRYALLVGRIPEESTGLWGDYNDDGSVNAADYTVYRNRMSGIGGTTLDNEFATPGMVTVHDYLFWKSQYGAGMGSGTGAGIGAPDVPEPTAMVLALTAALTLAVGQRRRRR